MMTSGRAQNSNWNAVGGVVAGAIHLRKDKPCQDALHIQTHKNYTIACVADGHGSAACPHSDEGSKAAVKVASELLASILNKDLEASTMSAHKDIWLPKQIETKWKDEVKKIHAIKERELIDPFPYTLYGTTLLALAATESFVFAMQIGDGDILMVDDTSTARPVLATEEKVGEDTESLCQDDAWQYVRTQIIPWNTSTGSPMFLISTDGYANSFTGFSGFAKAGADFLGLWQDEGHEYISQNIEEWLRLSSDKGSGDDIAIALIGRNHPS